MISIFRDLAQTILVTILIENLERIECTLMFIYREVLARFACGSSEDRGKQIGS